ncbi:MAG: S41 family peptidase [Chloroflexota bacterium]
MTVNVLTRVFLACALVAAVGATHAGNALASPPAGLTSGLERVLADSASTAPVLSEGYQKLLDFFVLPLKSGDILDAAWDAGVTALSQAGAGAPTGDRPRFSNQKDADWKTFAESYAELVQLADGKLDRAILDRVILAGMAASAHENHTRFISKEQFKEAQSAISNNVRYGGIGARFNRELVVIEVFDGSPAARQGLRPGDQLLQVDGASVEGQTPTEASARVRGEIGTSVTLTVRRSGELASLAFTREEIKLDWLVARVSDDGIGFMTVRQFPSPQAIGAFNKAIETFQAQDVSALVIDLRGNSGGSVDTGEQMLSRFIKSGPLYQRIDRRGGQRTVQAFGDHWGKNVPIVVLTDGGSGSMSEIFAAAMQENGVARVLGTKTAGSVAASVYHPLSDGSAMQIAHSLIKSSQGKTLDNSGLEPDEVVELDAAALRAGRDTQREAAVDYLRRQVGMARASSATE